ncbi:(Fe-S)-binding protein [Rhizobium sp. CSW-27]|uniref:(Fe-S)-binding protein n=1 Tax=Rhizobium sp. CSW-27 TaxID=2839985 RepID=UPI001C024ACF|nr:(Fe-S)-binding protein [Rhizobium sp. CSW-27]MBT9370849.1 (Fe-S)-binding protein [Rhizobium sp. CSW-27]
MNDASLPGERLASMDRCTRCSQCKFVPVPKSKAHMSACPSMDFVEFHAGSASGQLIMASGIAHGEFGYTPSMLETVSACTMCGACDTACKVNFAEIVEPLDGLYALRARMVADGQSPKRHREVMDKIAAFGNSQGLPRSDRANWASGLAFLPRADILVHVGSVLSYDTGKHDSLQAIVRTLQQAGLSLAYLGQDEGSCGMLAWDLGYHKQAKALAETFIRQVRQAGARTVVTFSSSAISVYRSIYPRMGIDLSGIRFLHFTEFLLALTAKGLVSLTPSGQYAGGTVAFHDTCKLGRLTEPYQEADRSVTKEMGGIFASRSPQALHFSRNGIYDAPRALLKHMGIEVEELERSREFSYCCGAQGGVKETLPAAAKMAARNRLAELQETESEILVSACGNCAHHLGKHVRAPATVIDLIDILAPNLAPCSSRETGVTATEGAC